MSVPADWLWSTGRGGVNYKISVIVSLQPLKYCGSGFYFQTSEVTFAGQVMTTYSCPTNTCTPLATNMSTMGMGPAHTTCCTGNQCNDGTSKSYKQHLNSLTQNWLQSHKLFSYSTQLNTKFILLINVKMPTLVGILTFISTINTTYERL